MSRDCSKTTLLAFCTTGRHGKCVENIFDEKNQTLRFENLEMGFVFLEYINGDNWSA